MHIYIINTQSSLIDMSIYNQCFGDAGPEQSWFFFNSTDELLGQPTQLGMDVQCIPDGLHDSAGLILSPGLATYFYGVCLN